MFGIKEFCLNMETDAYGGSIELVEDGIRAMTGQIQADSFADAAEALASIEQYVDDILVYTDGILPLVNLLDLCMRYVERGQESFRDTEEVVNGFIALIQGRKEEQSRYLSAIARIGSNLVPPSCKFGTFSTSGSVMAILDAAKQQGKQIRAVCFEARPHNEGYRTFREIGEMGIPVELGVDALLCELIPGCDLFVIGADAIASDGRVFAKTGSFSAALTCHYFGVPFYIAADTSKLDPMSLQGFPMKDSSRPPEEVASLEMPEGCAVRNVSFELIPAELIRGIITEKGLITPYAACLLMEPDRMSKRMVQKLENWVVTK